jgi:hypothetical protein
MLQAWNAVTGAEVVPSRVLSDFKLPVLAWYLPVSGKGRADRLHVVSGPAPDGRFACLTYVLEKNTVRAPAMPIPSPGEAAGEWSVTAAGNGKVVVATRTTGGRLLALTLPGAAWQTVADAVPAGHLDTYANYDRAWVEWLDSQFGFRRAAVRAE